MPDGRLIRTTDKHRGGAGQVAYIVAVSDSDKAIELIRKKVVAAGDVVEDLGRVSQELLNSLRLEAGEFMPMGEKP
jgi:hypothetical protein